jgi:NADH-quinone oxidoreductase subunit G
MQQSNVREHIAISVDGRQVEVAARLNVVDALARVGVSIPVFCHHPRLEPVGMCRMCLVEIGTPERDRASGATTRDEQGQPVIRWMPKLQTGCTTQVSEGMHVRTMSPAVAGGRRAVLELLLTSHPLDCPVCDKGGECPLQHLTMAYGPGTTRFEVGSKFRFPKPVPLGPLIVLDRERCIQCARCVRFQDEIAGDSVLAFENRGRGMEIVSYSEPLFDSPFSGNTTDICPVGALTTRDFRFKSRPWEVVGIGSICPHCPVGCNLSLDVRSGNVQRVMPRRNEDVNDIWICDKGRFGYHFADSGQRLTQPLLRTDRGQLAACTWGEALAFVARRLADLKSETGPDSIGGICGDGLSNEDIYMFQRLVRAVLGTNNVDNRPGFVRDNSVARAGAGVGTRVHELRAGAVVLVVGCDVQHEAPILDLSIRQAARNGASVITLSPFPSKLDATASLTVRSSAHSAYSLVAAVVRETLERRPADGPAQVVDVGQLQAAVEPYAMAKVSQQHPVRSEDMGRLADVLAGADDLLIIYGAHAAASRVQTLLAGLLLATGHVARPGNGLLAVGPHANSQGAADMGALPHFLPGYAPLDDSVARDRLASHWPALPRESAGLGAAQMLGALLPDAAPGARLRGMYVVGTDPVGDDGRLAQAFAKLELLVVQELFMTPTAELAHVVLPAQSQSERQGTYTNLGRRVQLFHPAARVVGQCRPDWIILRDIAALMGREEPFHHASDVMREIAACVPGYEGMLYSELGRSPRARLGHSILPFAAETPARAVDYEGTVYPNRWREGKAWPSLPERPDVSRVSAWPGGQVESPPPSAPATMAAMPVTRLYDRGRLIACSHLIDPLVPEPYVEISTYDSLPLGLEDGDMAEVRSQHGSLCARVRIREGLTPRLVLIPLGLGGTSAEASLFDSAAYIEVVIRAVGKSEATDGSTRASR